VYVIVRPDGTFRNERDIFIFEKWCAVFADKNYPLIQERLIDVIHYAILAPIWDGALSGGPLYRI